MQLLKPCYPDYLLKHARQSRRLTIQQVAAKTGIAKEEYEQMEAGCTIISTTDAELLSTLLKINPQYIKAHNMQLQLLYVVKDIMEMDKKKIASLTKALKRKIRI